MNIKKICFLNSKKIKSLAAYSLAFSSLFCFLGASRDAYSASCDNALRTAKLCSLGLIGSTAAGFISYVGAHMMNEYYNNQPNPTLSLDKSQHNVVFFYSFKDTGDKSLNDAQEVNTLPINQHKMLTQYSRYNGWDVSSLFWEWFHVIKNIRAGGSEFLYESDYPLFPVANDKESYENFAKDYLKMMHYIVTEVGNDKIFNLVKYNNKYDVSEIMSSSPKVYEDILLKDNPESHSEQLAKEFLQDLYNNLNIHAVLLPNSSLEPVRHSVFSRNDLCLKTVSSEKELNVFKSQTWLKSTLGCKLYTLDKKLDFNGFISALKKEIKVNENGEVRTEL